MAIGKLEEDLLIDFWNQNRDLIEAVADATILSKNSSDEDKEMANGISKSVKKAKIRYNNINEYLEQEKKNLPEELKSISVKLIDRINQEIQKVEITYATSINIKNPNSKNIGNVILYIVIQNKKIIFSFVKDDAYNRLIGEYPEGKIRNNKGKINFGIELNKENNFNFEK